MDEHSHVFVVRGDLTKIACHARIVPGQKQTDGTFKVGSSWTHSVSSEVPEDCDGRTGILRPSGNGSSKAIPIFADVGGSRSRPTTWYIEGARAFVERAVEELRKRGTHRLERERTLLCLNLVGAGKGGANPGEIARELLPELRKLAKEHRVDIAIVERDAAKVSAVQFIRKHVSKEQWPSDLRQDDAVALGRKARGEELVLFLGAGVGQAAGLPCWRDLLKELWKRCEGSEGTRFTQLASKVDFLDIAEIIRRDLGEGLPKEISSILSKGKIGYSLAHGLLAGLPSAEAVTTNYDQLFEEAIRAPETNGAAREQLAVLPGVNPQGHRRWLLKLHGCVSKPDSIVLTRDDYAGYRKEREALVGIVQAMLMTKHMLFVGFSLNDPNFHQIVHDVRRAADQPARNPAPAEKMGTNLALFEEPLLRSLWSQDLTWVPMKEGDYDHKEAKDAARKLEIFLDRVALEAADVGAHLLDDRLAESLPEEDQQFKDALKEFIGSLDGLAHTEAGSRIVALAERMGYRRDSKTERSSAKDGADKRIERQDSVCPSSREPARRSASNR